MSPARHPSAVRVILVGVSGSGVLPALRFCSERKCLFLIVHTFRLDSSISSFKGLRTLSSYRMPDSRRVTNIEKKLGLKWERGVSLAKRESCKVRVIKRLVDDIDELKQKYVSVLPSQLRHMEQFNSDCYELYKKHAPRLWADPPADRSAWLVNASVNTWNGLYTRDLFVGKDDEL